VVDSGSFAPGAEEVELRWAAEARARGNFVIGIGPASHTRLAAACDAVLGTACPDGGVIAASAGSSSSGAICPTGGEHPEKTTIGFSE
jgi:hypothetical protein